MHGLYSRTTSWSMASQLLSLRSGNISLAAYARRQQFGGAITTLGMIQLGGVIDNWTITNKRHTRTTQETQKLNFLLLSLDRTQAHLPCSCVCTHHTRSTVTRRSHVSHTTARSRQVFYTTAEWRCPMSRRKTPTPLRPQRPDAANVTRRLLLQCQSSRDAYSPKGHRLPYARRLPHVAHLR